MTSTDCYTELTKVGFEQYPNGYTYGKFINNKLAYTAHVGWPANQPENCLISIYNKKGFPEIENARLSHNREQLINILQQINKISI